MENTGAIVSAQGPRCANRRVIVTCGPSFEPIDEVRRITSSSTGELGVLLGRELGRAGWEVVCCKGSGATFPDPEPPARVVRFQTNDDLLGLLKACAKEGGVAAVFHAAALCDYRVASIHDAHGGCVQSPKIPSRAGTLHLVLEPATKVIGALRGLFPTSLLVGWKYELAGTRSEVVEKARRQMLEGRIDACVVNGRAFGAGFGFCQLSSQLVELENKPALARFLAGWLAGAEGQGS